MTFSEYLKKNWLTFVISVVPMLLLYGSVAAVAKLSVWFYIIAPLSVIFMTTLTVATLYHRWDAGK